MNHLAAFEVLILKSIVRVYCVEVDSFELDLVNFFHRVEDIQQGFASNCSIEHTLFLLPFLI